MSVAHLAIKVSAIAKRQRRAQNCRPKRRALRRFFRPPAPILFSFTLGVAMPEAKHAKPASLFPLRNPPVAEIFAHSADQWFATQAALLADVDALTQVWLHRRREGVDATQQAIQQMAGCQNPRAMLHI